MGGCHCGGAQAHLTRRLVGGNVTIWLQCKSCGASIQGAMSKRDHFGWQDYPEWDVDLVEKTEAEREAQWQRRLDGFDAERATIMRNREQRRAEYSAWLETSKEWYELRERVAKRCNYLCESCLNARISDVHHETYELGRLPPAWLLRGVCRPCHQRLHDGWRGEDEVT